MSRDKESREEAQVERAHERIGLLHGGGDVVSNFGAFKLRAASAFVQQVRHHVWLIIWGFGRSSHDWKDGRQNILVLVTGFHRQLSTHMAMLELT